MSYARQVLLDSPAAFWPLDEASGTFQDVSGNGRNFTLAAGTPSYRAGQAAPGVYAPTPNSTMRLSRTATGAMDPGTGDFAWSAWYRGTFSHGSSDFETLFEYDSNSSGLGLDIYTTSASFGVNGGLRVWCANNVLNSTVAFNTGRSTYVWVERRSNVLGLYFNNVLDVTATRSGNIAGYGISAFHNSNQDSGYHLRQNTYLGQMAWWVGTIPSADRRKVHYEAGLRGGVAATGGFGG